MERQWNVRAPNEEARVCALKGCSKRFFTQYPQQKFCSKEHQQIHHSIANRAYQREYQKTYKRERKLKEAVQRVCPICGRTFETTHVRKKYDREICARRAARAQQSKYHEKIGKPEFVRIYGSGDENVLGYSSVPRAMRVPIDEDPVFLFVEEQQPADKHSEVLDYIYSLQRQGQVIYGKFAELQSTPDYFKLVIGRLDHALSNVSEVKLQKARQEILNERHIENQQYTQNPPEEVLRDVFRDELISLAHKYGVSIRELDKGVKELRSLLRKRPL